MVRFLSRPSLEPYRKYLVEPAPDDAAGAGLSARSGLSVRFLGVTTLLFSDGQTCLMTDGFFTRPGGLLKIAIGRKVTPDKGIIRHGLQRACVDHLAAVIPLHSHYDHAMDAPEVALQTSATLLGSESTANIGRGWELPETQMEMVTPDKAYNFGDFTLTFIETAHVPLRLNVSQRGTMIEEPLVPPAAALEYKVGQVYSLHIEHPLGKVLVHGSAGYLPGALDGVSAEVVYLSVGGLGYLDRGYKDTLFEEVLSATGATRLIPLHYDDFTVPLEQPPRLIPRPLDDVKASLDFLVEKAEMQPDLELQLLPVWVEVIVFNHGRRESENVVRSA